MKKRILICVVICIMSALCVLGLVACGDKDKDSGEVTVDGITYSLNSDKTGYTLKEVKSPTSDTEFIIPSVVKGKPVTAISRRALGQNCSHFTIITVPDSVTDIEGGAFGNCTEIENITVPFVGSRDSLELSSDFKSDYFYSIFGTEDYFLTSITKLRKVTIIGGTVISNYAFKELTTLEEVILPDTLTSIGYSAFDGCTGLKKIDIPQNVTYIDSYAFRGCNSLKSVDIPDSVTEIDAYAFADCSRLRKVTLGRNVSTIGNNAFSCSRLVEVCNMSALEIKKSGNGNGAIGEHLVHIYGEDGESRIGVSDDGYVFVSNPDNNEYYLIDYDGNATELVLPDTYLEMNYVVWANAFAFCNGVTKITVPENVTLAYWALRGLTELREAVIHAHISKINGMFENYENLVTVTLPSSVRHLEMNPFQNCNNLKDIYYGGTMEAWNSIYKDAYWRIPDAVIVHCSDGNLDRNGNQI